MRRATYDPGVSDYLPTMTPTSQPTVLTTVLNIDQRTNERSSMCFDSDSPLLSVTIVPTYTSATEEVILKEISPLYMVIRWLQ